MKSHLTTITACLVLPLMAFGGGELNALDEQFLKGLEDLKREYRASLAELLERVSHIDLYRVGEPERKTEGAIDPFAGKEGYWELGDFEYRIIEEKKIEGDELDLWKNALSSLLVPEEPECWISRHHSDTVLIVYGTGIDPLFEESPMFEITISWEYNNYLLRYPFLDMDRHVM